MLIEQLDVQNFGSYHDERIDFAPGTNAIIGPNGAGKSGLLRAIGFCLFGYQSGKLADYLREGARSGCVTVRLLSSLDDQRYEIARAFTDKTTTRYRVFTAVDRQLLVEGAADVHEWVRQHLRVGSDADLGRLFESTIGVPQGTFCAPFLLAATQRKVIFDPLLRVQEYRKASDYLRPTIGMLKDQAAHHKADIARLEGMLSGLAALQEERATLDNALLRLGKAQVLYEKMLAVYELQLEELAQAEAHAKEAEQHAAEAWTRLDAHGSILTSARSAFSTAKLAKQRLVETLAAHTAYLNADSRLEELDASRRVRDGLLEEQRHARATLAQLIAVKAREPQAQQELAEAEQRAADIGLGVSHAGLVEEGLRLLEVEIERAQAMSQDLMRSSGSVQAIVNVLSKQNLLLEDSEIAVCPTCGTQLTPEHRQELLARNQAQIEQHGANLSKISETVSGLVGKGKTLSRRQQKERGKLQALPTALDLSKARKESRRRLETLTALRRKIDSAADDQEVIDRLDQELATYADLDDQVSQFQEQRRENQAGHDTYMGNEILARELGDREDHLAEVKVEHARLDQAYKSAKVTFEVNSAAYDAQRHANIRREATVARESIAATDAELTLNRERLGVVKKSLLYLETAQGAHDGLVTQLKETEETQATIQWIRELLREAGPLVTRRFVRQISQEASSIYADLMGDTANRLRWSQDYEVSLDVRGHRRTFSQLSGGERMCAALAVRLALLRETSAIDVAFLDEPTTHLDPERRESLAQRLGQVKGFSQLFIISHDDTFQSAAEKTIRIVKDAGGSHANTE